MAFTPWYTSSKIIDAVQRKIAIPLNQGTFTEQDILNFATEELLVSMLPQIMSFHEEYYVWSVDVPLITDKTRYEIPDRAIGVKLRDIFYKDTGGNLFEMVRISPEDKSTFKGLTYSNQIAEKYYLENNQIVLMTQNTTTGSGFLRMSFYIRPNVLVPETRACYIDYFSKNVVVNNALLTSGDNIVINNVMYVAGTDFAIGATSSDTANNLAMAVNPTVRTATALSNTVTVTYTDVTMKFLTDSSGMAIQSSITLNMTGSIPSNMVEHSLIDLLQTKSGHRIRAYDIVLDNGSLSDTSITLPASVIPADLLVGDYVATASESIIPQIPTDLHPMFCEKICARILSSMGDTQGLAMVNDKIARDENMQGMMLDNRVEGSPQKVMPRRSLMRYGKVGWNRRF